MKKTIKPATPEQVQYICDICGEEIEQDTYGTSVIEVTEQDVEGNGWNVWPVVRNYHAHRKCMGSLLQIMRSNYNKT